MSTHPFLQAIIFGGFILAEWAAVRLGSIRWIGLLLDNTLGFLGP